MKQLDGRHPVLRRVSLFVLVWFVLAACAEATPAPPLVRHPTATLTALSPPPAIPPTWTPTFTATPRSPTPTRTFTRTPTITSTPDAEHVCDSFELFAWPEDGIRIAAEGRIAFGWRGAPADAIIRVALLNRATDEGILVEWPPDQAFNMAVELAYLPGPGIYDWTLSVYYAALGDLCAHDGWFVVRPASASPTPTPGLPASEHPATP